MSSVQTHMHEELQRKHEELQQLIVHQQEELKRVSEQLFIARYGILSPLINVSDFQRFASEFEAKVQKLKVNTFIRFFNFQVQLPCDSNLCQPEARCCPSPRSDISSQTTNEPVQGMSVHSVPVSIVAMQPFSRFTTAQSIGDTTVPLMSQQQHEQNQSQKTHQESHMDPMLPFELCPKNNTVYASMESAASAQTDRN